MRRQAGGDAARGRLTSLSYPITSDKVKTQAYCDLTKLEGQVKAVQQTTDPKTVEMLTKQAEALIDKLGPEYFKLMDRIGASRSEIQ